MSERGLVSKSSRELFGDFAGTYGEAHGINQFFRVARNIDELTERINTRGLKLTEMKAGKDVFYVVYRDEEGSNEGIPMHGLPGKNEGIWVSDIESFNELIGPA